MTDSPHGMEARFSAEALIELVHRYYPAGLHGDDPRYRQSAEYQRLGAVRRAASEDDAAWKAFLKQVREHFPQCTLWELPGPLYDPSRGVRVYLPDAPGPAGEHQALVVLASILAPVHLLHASHEVNADAGESGSRFQLPPFPPEFHPYESRLDMLIRSSLGSTRLPNEVLHAPVPDLQVGNLPQGEARLLHCLFTDDLW